MYAAPSTELTAVSKGELRAKLKEMMCDVEKLSIHCTLDRESHLMLTQMSKQTASLDKQLDRTTGSVNMISTLLDEMFSSADSIQATIPSICEMQDQLRSMECTTYYSDSSLSNKQ